MSRKITKNIRTEFKYLVKDLQRGKITYVEIGEKLMKYGLYQDFYGVFELLETDIKPRVLIRLGRAAKKRGAYVRVSDLYLTWSRINKKDEFSLTRGYENYHLIPFLKLKRYTEVKTMLVTTDYFQFENLDGLDVDFRSHASFGECRNLSEIKNVKYL
jgi:hypothetical protein